jgi:hypothetical protein
MLERDTLEQVIKSFSLPISGTTISYILEEHDLEGRTGLRFAWIFNSREEAEAKLLKEIALYGNKWAYMMYISVDTD